MRLTGVVRELQRTRIARVKAGWGHPFLQAFDLRPVVPLQKAPRVTAGGLSCTRHQVLEKPSHGDLLRRFSAIQWDSQVTGAHNERPEMASRGLRPQRF